MHQLEAQNTASTDEDGYWIMTITEEEESAESIHSMKPTVNGQEISEQGYSRAGDG